MEERASRTAALLGEEAMARLKAAHVLIVGVGGVGGWCAEALARTGVGALTLMDDDVVAASNLNRQCAATVPTLGCVKVEAMRERLLAVNPDCRVTALKKRWDSSVQPSTSNLQPLSSFDVVVDAIDSVDCKAALIAEALGANVPIVSSMGAALRLDPTRVRVTAFDQVMGDGLARAVRKRLKAGGVDAGKVRAVWSDERSREAVIRGSYMPVVAAFGMCLAAETVNRLI